MVSCFFAFSFRSSGQYCLMPPPCLVHRCAGCSHHIHLRLEPPGGEGKWDAIVECKRQQAEFDDASFSVWWYIRRLYGVEC